MSRFLIRLLATVIGVTVLFNLTACTRPDSGTVIPPAKREQLFQLQGRIQQGPSTGLNLSGELRTSIDSASRWQGTLIRESGVPVTVTGQIDGLAIHLSFDLGDDNAVLGVGTLQHSIDNPQGTAGGLLTGPQPGDSGDWFGSWTTIVTPATPSPVNPAAPDNSPAATDILILGVLIFVAAVLFAVLLRSKVNGPALYTRTRSRSTVPFVKASAQTVEPERWPGEATLPLAQFATTYAHGDDHYDLSFTVESARGEFLGECGVGISATIDNRFSHTTIDSAAAAWLESLATQEVSGKHQAVTALEVWLFDKHDINTVTKVLRAAQGFYQPAPRAARDPVQEVIVIEPDQDVTLQTKALRLRAHISAVEYLAADSGSAGVFKQVTLKLAVWST